jgi:hypothetical protein
MLRLLAGGWLCCVALPVLAQQSASDAVLAKNLSSKSAALPQGAVKLRFDPERFTVQPAASSAAAPETPPTAVPATVTGSATLPTSVGTVAPPPRPRHVTVRAPHAAAATTVQLPLALEGVALDPDKVRVISAGGATIKAQDRQKPVLELPVNGRAIVSSEQGKQSAERDPIKVDEKTALPWLVIETERRGDTQAVRAARPFLTLARAITWHAAQQRHVAEFLFGLDPEGGVAGPLQQPVEARFAVSCDDVEPALARVEKIGPGGYGSVRVSCSPAVKNEQAQQFLTVHVEQGTLRYPFEIPHRPGPLRLLASALSVPGFGFGKLALTAEQLEEDGSPLRAARASELQLSADRSALDVSGLQIAPGATSATIEVHPRGIGEVQLSLVQGELRSDPLRLQLTWPLLAVLAMIAGGTLGGLLFVFERGDKRAGSARRRTHAAIRRAIEGALVGLLVTTLMLIMPNVAAVLSWASSTELGLFVVAAFAGFVGTPLLDRLAQLVFPALGASKERE